MKFSVRQSFESDHISLCIELSGHDLMTMGEEEHTALLRALEFLREKEVLQMLIDLFTKIKMEKYPDPRIESGLTITLQAEPSTENQVGRQPDSSLLPGISEHS